MSEEYINVKLERLIEKLLRETDYFDEIDLKEVEALRIILFGPLED